MISSVSIQLGFALGVAFAALLLDAFAAIRGVEVGVTEMQLVFFVLAAITLAAIFPIFGLSKQEGDDVSGHVTKSVST